MNTEIFDNGFFEKLNTLKIGLTMLLSEGMSGIRKSSAKGNSVEFSDFREYIPGDDIRRIDWNAYGRTDKLYIKQFMEEKEGIYNLFLDTSQSMRFGTPGKYKMALQIAGALSYIILNNLDRVSLNEMKENSLVKGKGVTGKRAFPFLLEELSQMEFAGATTLSQAILSRPVQRGGTSIIISDFLDASGIEDAIKYLAYRKQTIVLIQILAPEEERIDYEGTLHLVDMETGQKVKITMTNAAIREYGKRLETWKGDLKIMAMKYGVSYVYLRSDESLQAAMLHGLNGVMAAK